MRSSLASKLFIISCVACIAVSCLLIPGTSRPTAAAAAPCSLTPIGSIGGIVLSVDVANSLVYVGEANAFTILDMQEAPQTTIISRLSLPGPVYDVQIVGTRAYLAVGSAGLFIVDVGNPEQPYVLTSMVSVGNVQQVFVVGDTAYVATRDRGLLIIDIRTPSSPRIIGTYAVPFASNPHAQVLQVVGSFAYVATTLRGNTGGVQLLDVSNPAAPHVVSAFGSSTSMDGVDALYVTGSIVYVAGSDGLEIFDTSTPAAPQRLAVYTSGGSGSAIYVDHDRAYFTSANNSLQIIDVSVPGNPQLLSELAMPPHGWEIAIDGPLAYVTAYRSGLHLLDVRDPADPQWRESGYAIGVVWDAQVAGAVAYLATGERGLHVVDISTPALPQPLTRVSTAWSAYALHVVGNRVYVAMHNDRDPAKQGVQIFDVSDPARPFLLGTYVTPMIVRQLTVQNDVVYAVGNLGLEIIDVAQPDQPVLRAATRGTVLSTPSYDIQLIGSLAYVATDQGLRIYDVRTASTPTLVWGEQAGQATGVQVVDTIAYRLSGNVVTSYDVTNPSQPHLYGRWRLPYAADDMSVSRDLVYAASSTFDTPSVSVFDVRDPTQVTASVCGSSMIPVTAVRVSVADERVLVSSLIGGFHMLRAGDVMSTPTVAPVTSTPAPSGTPTSVTPSTPTATSTSLPEPTPLLSIQPSPTNEVRPSRYSIFLPIIVRYAGSKTPP